MVRVGIVGVTGYTGMELARILSRHPSVTLTYATSRQWAGKRLSQALPQMEGEGDIEVSSFDPVLAAKEAEILFLCLPHGGAMDAAAALLSEGPKVVDLSADFRLKDPDLYKEWYQTPHRQPQLLHVAVPGFPELHREEVRKSRFVANPGCYPTSIVLALAPLLEQGWIRTEGIIADSKSGVSGAGRESAPHLHFPEVEGNFFAYKVAGTHRHTCEIEQEVSFLAAKQVRLTFTPHLLPVSRGILSSIYAEPARTDITEEKLVDLFRDRYGKESFLRIRSPGEGLPSLKETRGTNLCLIAPRFDRRTGRIILLSCIDNLVKGASGQAVQNMNLMMGLPEEAGLMDLPLLP